MQRAKAFFYVCAGLFLLALGYHLGARNAAAQSTGGFDCVTVIDNGNTTAVIGRQVWYWNNGGPPALITSVPVPGTSQVVAANRGGASFAAVAVLADGEEWGFPYSGTTWSLLAQWPVGVTAATHESWGQVKVEHR